MKKFSAVLALCAIFISIPVQASVNFAKKNSSEPAPPIEAPLRELRVGEFLEFDVFWMGVHVGLASLEVKEIVTESDRPAYHVVAVARTNDVLSKIFPVHDEIHSKIDVQGLYSHEFRKTLREGRYRADERVRFDHAEKKGRYESFLNQSRKEFDIPGKPQDFLSIFYWFRLQPLEVGRSVRGVLSDKGKDYDVELSVLGKKKEEMRGGQSVWTVEVEPKTRYKEVLYRRGRGWVQFTLDAARVPVLIRINTPFGPVTGALKTRIENA